MKKGMKGRREMLLYGGGGGSSSRVQFLSLQLVDPRRQGLLYFWYRRRSFVFVCFSSLGLLINQTYSTLYAGKKTKCQSPLIHGFTSPNLLFCL